MGNNRDNRDYLYSIYGKSTFVKVKPALGIEKILFAFVDRENKESIDCYINLLDYEELLESIKSRYFQRKIAEEKGKGDKYPKPVWESLLGGTTKKGKTIYRKFSISPGASQYAVFTAEMGPAVDSDGKCVPVKKTEANKSEFKVIRVGVMNYEEFRKMMMESEKYLNVWYEFHQKKVLWEELNKMMQRPFSNEKFVEMHQEYNEEEEQSKNNQKSSSPAATSTAANTPIATHTPSTTTTPSTPPLSIKSERFKSRSRLQEKNGFYYLYGCRKDDKEPIRILFLPDQIKKCPEDWKRFIDATKEKENISFSMAYAEKNGNIYFSSFVS